MKVTGIYFCRAVSLLSDRNERTGRVSRDLGSILRLGVCHSEGIITRAVGIAVISDHMCAFGKERNEEIGSLITDLRRPPVCIPIADRQARDMPHADQSRPHTLYHGHT